METTFVHADRETPSQSRAGGSTTATSQLELARKIATLTDLTAQQLRTEWRRLYRSHPPRLSRDLLVRTIAYRMQELAYGGLSKATQRKLVALTKELQTNGSIVSDPRSTHQAGCAACAGMAREDTHGRRDGGRFRICRKNLFLAQQDCADDHRCALVRSSFLRIESR